MDLLQQTDELFFTRTNLDLDQTKIVNMLSLAAMMANCFWKCGTPRCWPLTMVG